MYKTYKSFLLVIFLASVFAILVCGGSGGSSDNGGGNYNPVTPDSDLPTVYDKASTFDKKSNEIYTYSSNAENVAVDIPIGSTYFISITNKSGNTQKISLVSSVTASLRASSEEIQNDTDFSFIDTFKYNERDEAELQYRLNFINRLKQSKKSNVTRSVRASPSIADHSYEEEGEAYDIWTTDTYGKPYCLNNCKLVAVTEHAKFFVDQNDRYGYASSKGFMESVVKDGVFALKYVFDSDSVNIYNVILDNFGNFCDVDNDKKISVVITPFLTKIGVDGGYGSGLRGLFMYFCMLDDFVDKDEIPQARDQILLAPPVGGVGVETDKNMAEAITNLCHEYQHLVNFSQRFFRNGVYSFDESVEGIKYAEELGFDEGCSVCAEALFRRERGKRGFPSLYDSQTGSYVTREYTGNDWYNRFNNISFSNVFPFNPFSSSNYGRNGLFMLYLHDRFGSENFKKLIQLPFTGSDLQTVIPQTLGTGESLDELQRDWHFALQHQYLMTEQKNKGETLTTDVRYKYGENEEIEWLRLNSQNKKVNSGSTSLSAGYSALYKLTPTQANLGDNFRFFIKSTGTATDKSLDINIIKL